MSKMSRKLSLDEMMAYVKQLLSIHRYNISFTINDWFFPNYIPHNQSLKYRCKKLYNAGLLERRIGISGEYQYKIKRKEYKIEYYNRGFLQKATWFM